MAGVCNADPVSAALLGPVIGAGSLATTPEGRVQLATALKPFAKGLAIVFRPIILAALLVLPGCSAVSTVTSIATAPVTWPANLQ